MQEILLKEDYQRLKKLTLFFLSNPVPFNVQDYEKQKKPRTREQSLFRLQNKFRKILLLAIYYLTKVDDVIPKLFQKLHQLIYASQFMTS